MKILFHILLDMNQKTKISTKFPRSKVGVATAVLSLGGVAVYSLGVINPLQASQSEYLQVDGVQNSVQYLTSLVIDSPTAKVEFKYDDASKAVRASGSLNMQNLVVGQGNESSASSVVFWWTKNNNQWANSVIVWGNSTTNEGNNNVIVLSPGSKSSSENTAILNGQNVVTNGKNITVVNGENSNVRGNYVTVFGNSSVGADHVVVFGDKVNNNKSNTFVFNGQDAQFVPEQESAFYANSKVAINGDHANATLDVHGGMMIGKRENYTVPTNWDSTGTIALFSKYGQTGLCGYDGKANRRVPLSESARKFWLCAPMWDLWNLPANAVSNNPQRSFPQVWNQNKTYGDWESPKWIYGSKDKPQHFLCADGFVPDNSDPIGKTGVKCTPCQWAKSGDLSCTTHKGDNSEAKQNCPQGVPYNETSKKCERTKSTKCMPGLGVQKMEPDTQIETYNADRWVWEVTQKCKAVKCQEGYSLEGESCIKNNNIKCLDPNKITFHNINPENITKLKYRDYGKNGYRIKVGSCGISSGYVAYDSFSTWLNISTPYYYGDGGENRLRISGYNPRTFDVSENTYDTWWVYPVRLQKDWCDEEIILEFNQDRPGKSALAGEKCVKNNEACLDPNKITFHNINPQNVTRVGDDYSIKVGSGGISSGYIAYNWSSSWLNISLVNDWGNSWGVSVYNYRSFDIFKNTYDTGWNYQLKVQKNWCAKEIVFEINQDRGSVLPKVEWRCEEILRTQQEWGDCWGPFSEKWNSCGDFYPGRWYFYKNGFWDDTGEWTPAWIDEKTKRLFIFKKLYTCYSKDGKIIPAYQDDCDHLEKRDANFCLVPKNIPQLGTLKGKRRTVVLSVKCGKDSVKNISFNAGGQPFKFDLNDYWFGQKNIYWLDLERSDIAGYLRLLDLTDVKIDTANNGIRTNLKKGDDEAFLKSQLSLDPEDKVYSFVCDLDK